MLGAMTMVSGNTLAEVAGLIGDPARANMLSALMDGRALTAGELAWAAGVSAPTASGHLARLAEARLVAVERQGRHRYHRLATPEVARAVEALMTVAAAGPRRHRPAGPRDEALRAARTCYDHLAGRLGVALADSLLARGPRRGRGRGRRGRRHGCRWGLPQRPARGRLCDTAAGARLCRTCLDWSERRPHLAGRLGAALCRRALELGWIERARDGRAVAVTPAGRRGFAEVFGIASP